MTTTATSPPITGREKNTRGRVILRLIFSRSEPMRIVAEIEAGRDITQWAFARDLIHEALRRGTAGLGDVRLTVDGQTVAIDLHSCDPDYGIGETCTMTFPRAPIAAFLTYTLSLAPLDAGLDETDLDAGLLRLLSQSGY